jgi:hypothetical protein
MWLYGQTDWTVRCNRLWCGESSQHAPKTESSNPRDVSRGEEASADASADIKRTKRPAPGAQPASAVRLARSHLLSPLASPHGEGGEQYLRRSSSIEARPLRNRKALSRVMPFGGLGGLNKSPNGRGVIENTHSNMLTETQGPGSWRPTHPEASVQASPSPSQRTSPISVCRRFNILVQCLFSILVHPCTAGPYPITLSAGTVQPFAPRTSCVIMLDASNVLEFSRNKVQTSTRVQTTSQLDHCHFKDAPLSWKIVLLCE